MRDDVKRCVEALRTCDLPQNVQPVAFYVCRDCLAYEPDVTCLNNLTAADLIESLAAELEKVKRERDGLNILLAQAQSMLETRTRERDAAVEDLKENSYTPCATCGKRIDNKSCTEFGERMPCDMINIFRCEMYEWRGVKED